MPVNGFSFMNEKFFQIIVQQSLRRARMLKFAQKKPGMMVPCWAFDLKRDRAIPAVLAGSGWLQNFVRRGRNRRRKPTPRGVSQESRVLLASSPKEKIGRCPQFR